MFKQEKDAYRNIISTMHELHRAVRSEKEKTAQDGGLISEYLTDCQGGAVSIGESLEKDMNRYPDIYDKVPEIISILEKYCEAVFRVASSGEDIDVAEDLLSEAETLIDELPLRFRFAFYPYKAEMWDSLESIYLAAEKSPYIDAYVCPAPYFTFNNEKKEWEICYDGDRFPEGLTLIPADRYSPEQDTPDAAFVHYPYDDKNYVTQLHPSFHSHELKKRVPCLVYVPYYVTSGHIALDHRHLPVYENMDLAIFQSDAAKESCQGMDYYDKILPLGSPKLDKVIKKCKAGVEMPEEWKGVLYGKKILMLNTTISDILSANGLLLKKLKYFFDQMKADQRVAVIWRPHPLLRSTLNAMRPELLKEYDELVEGFLADKVGVLDTTADISETIAISDGYIGSPGSSVINYYEAVAKPVFIMENRITAEVSEDERRKLRINGMCYGNGRMYFTAPYSDRIFAVSLSDPDHLLSSEAAIEDVPKYRSPFGALSYIDGSLYPSPIFAKEALEYDPASKEARFIGGDARHDDERQYFCVAAGKSVFYFPTAEPKLMEYVTEKGEFIYHQNCLIGLWKETEWSLGVPIIFGYAVFEDKLYLTTGENNRILIIEAGTGNYSLVQVGEKDLKIIIKGVCEKGYYIADREDLTALYMVPFEKLSDKKAWIKISIPSDAGYMPIEYEKVGPYAAVLSMGEYDIAIPYRVTGMLRIRRDTWEADAISAPLFAGALEPGIMFYPETDGVTGPFAVIDDRRMALWMPHDKTVAVIDVYTGEYEAFPLIIPEDVMAGFDAPEAGFDMGDSWDAYFQQESEIFTLNRFLTLFTEDRLESIKELQKNAISGMANNMDGTCGEKVVEAVLTRLKAKL